MTGVFRAPTAPVERTRWLLLIFAVCCLLVVPPRMLAGDAAPAVVRAGAAAAAVVLGGWWLRRYRMSTFPPWALPAEAAALGLVAAGLHDWAAALGLTLAGVAFRSLFGPWPHALAYALAGLAAALAGVAATEPGAIPALLKVAPAVPLLALLTAAFAEACARQERAAARERVFARLGASLAMTADATVVGRHTAEAAVRLLAGVPGAWAAVVRAALDAEEVSAVAGPAPADLDAGPGRDRAEDFTLGTGTMRYGSLLVGGDEPLPAEVRPAMQTLAAQASLGLANAGRAAALQHQAFHDALTDLPNRQQLREHLSRALGRARRGSPVAVLLINVDRFRRVNDTYGHSAGDQLLAAVAQRLRDTIRTADTAARLGGDEFAVVLDGMDSPADAALVAGRLLTAIRAPVHAAGVQLAPSACIGVAAWRNHAEIDQLLHDADAAMHAAKLAGQGRVAVITDGTVKVLSPILIGA